ncbi:MAG: hypothetical protein ABII71_06065 [Candidatus Micrarchaeota archaeon]
MASTLLKIIIAIVSIAIGIGITFISSDILTLDFNTQIIVGIVMTLASFVSLYFMSKGNG